MNPANGHAVAAVGYDGADITIVTWGHIKKMTWAFYEAYSDEAWAVLSPDWFKEGRSPRYGFDIDTLAMEIDRIG